MALQKVNITDRSISRNVTTDYKKAICEYIWNGFDANATRIDIEFSVNELGGVTSLTVRDNGEGINRTTLAQTFGCFQDSIKKKSYQWSSQIKGKKGKGRYSFNCFATDAIWETIFRHEDKLLKYRVSIKAGNNNHYDDGNPEDLQVTTDPTGTLVTFVNVSLSKDHLQSDDFIDYLKREFAVFLQINKPFGKSIYINNERLEFETIIGDFKTHDITIKTEAESYAFNVSLIRWNEKIKENYIVYFLDNRMYERFEKTTSFNNKDTGFHHSVCVVSEYFNNFEPNELNEEVALDGSKNQKDKIFIELSKQLKKFLLIQEKLFIHEIGATELISRYQNSGVIRKTKSQYDAMIVEDLISTVKCIYCVEPRIFTNLKTDQAKTLIGFLELLLQTDKREDVIAIIENVVNLTDEERHSLVEVLQHTELSRITKVIQLLQNRCKTISALKNAVYNKDLDMNEVDDLQILIANSFWIFGEEYNIVTEAEPDFEQALNKYIEKAHQNVKGVSKSRRNKTKLDHIDKNKEMDIFAFRQNINSNTIENIVIELKHPKIKLGEVEVSQVKTYMDVITSAPDFNASNMSWKFYLVGNDFDSSSYIRREIQSNRQWGKSGLIQHVDENGITYEIYVKKWSELFSDFEIRHNFLLSKLEMRRNALMAHPSTKSDVHQIVNNNIA
jgi:hypothetical protein